MPQSDATAEGNDEKVNLRLPEAFLDDVVNDEFRESPEFAKPLTAVKP